MAARKPPAPKPPKLPTPEPKAKAEPPKIRPLASVDKLAEAVGAGHADLEDFAPVEGQPALVDISWKAVFPDGERAASTLRTSRQAAIARGIAA